MAFSIKKPQSKPSRRALLSATVWGLLAAVGMILVTAICQEMDFKKGFALNWISYGLLLGFMIACPIWYKKKLRAEGVEVPLNTRQAYLTCVWLGILCATMYSLLLYAYIAKVDPSFIQAFVEVKQNAWMGVENLTEAERMQHLQELKNIQLTHIVMNVWSELIMIGVLAPLIVAVLVRKER